MLIPTLFCPKSWEGMSGDETKRFCTYCKKDVHNLQGLPLSERLTLLSTPAASICGRYQIAIRRPAKGKENTYRQHLLKYGTGVALTGSILIVLWEWQGREEKQKYYIAAGIPSSERGMPRKFYREHSSIVVGMLTADRWLEGEGGPIFPDAESLEVAPAGPRLDSFEVDKMMRESLPKIETAKPVVPLQK